MSKSSSKVYRIRPQMFLHVQDQITNVTRVEIGPQTLICQRHEVVVYGPTDMITVPPRHYIVIENPVRRDEKEGAIFDEFGQAVLSWGETEVRLAQDPFPLFPGEEIKERLTKLRMVYKNTALHLLCLQEHTDESGQERKVGDEYLFEGPGQYIPNVNAKVKKVAEAIVIKQNQALRLRAVEDCVDREGTRRTAGEEWLVTTVGAYLPGVYEKDLGLIQAVVLTDKRALHIRALFTFTDQFGIKRLNGEEWLVTNAQTETYIPSVHEEIARHVNITTLNSRQYCVIVNPRDDKGNTQWGCRKLVTGEKSFFLHPGESMERGIENVYVLNEEEGLVLTCTEPFTDDVDGKQIARSPGDRWMIRGPMEFIPSIGAQVLRTNRAISLGENEGIYVRNIKTGEVRAVIGSTYLLTENEELWEKELPTDFEELLATEKGFLVVNTARSREFVQTMQRKMNARDKTRVVRYNVRHNHAVQVYDFREDRARVEFGPALVLLQPGEVITTLHFSGGKPKRGGAIKSLHLRLGPEFSSDEISVETSDHCKLRIALTYNWQFEVNPDDQKSGDHAKLFAVQDFIGDMCKTISSRIRSSVSSVPFDSFHKTSAKLIRSTVFGVDEKGKVGKRFYFPANNLVVTGIDIRSIEPEDSKTRQALQRSVQLAIEITAKAQEASARHQQAALEQEAKGKLSRQQLVDKAEAEVANKKFMEAQVETRAVQNTGKARAEAQSTAEMLTIAAQAAVENAELTASAKEIELKSELDELEGRKTAEMAYQREKQALEEAQAKAMADIEVKKFKETIQAIGPETLQSIALAGPELQARLLKGLGLDPEFLQGGLPFVDDL